MIMLRDSGIALKTYKEARKDIGEYKCNAKIIDNDTTIVYEMFYKSIVETGSFANEHDLITIWLCTVNVFCKCGEYHRVSADIPAEYQIMDILQNLENIHDVSFGYPNKEPEGSLIVPILDERKISKKVEDVKYWI